MSSSILRAIVARGGFNPLTDIPSVAYWDMHASDAAYETLPGNTLATAQNDGIGAVLDLKRYKERGANVVTQDGSAWTASGSSPNQWTISGDTASVDNTGGTASCYIRHVGNPLTTGRLYELTFTVLSSNSIGGVCATTSTDNATPYVTGTGEYTFLIRAIGEIPTQFQFRANTDWAGSVDLSAVSVREIPGYHAIQDVAANQPVLNLENGIRSASFITDDVLPFPNSLSTFNFLHDGTGGELAVCCRVNDLDNAYYLFGNNGSSPNAVGVTLRVSQAGALFLRLGNGSGTYLSELTSASGVVVPGEKMVVGYSLGSDGQVSMYKNGQRIAGPSAIVGQPSAADAQYNFVVGLPGEGSSALAASMDYYSMAPTTAVLTDYQRQRLTSYMLRRAGA